MTAMSCQPSLPVRTPPASVARNEYLKPLVDASRKNSCDAGVRMALGSDAVAGNPLDDIAILEDVHFVMKQGVVVKHGRGAR